MYFDHQVHFNSCLPHTPPLGLVGKILLAIICLLNFFMPYRFSHSNLFYSCNTIWFEEEEGWCWHFFFVNLDMQGIPVLTFQEQQHLEDFEEGSRSQQLCCHGFWMHLLWLFHSTLCSSHLMLLLGMSLLEKGPFLCGLVALGGGNWLVIVSSTVVLLVKTTIQFILLFPAFSSFSV